MPFLRIVRDKRGYEYFSLVHQTSGRRGKVRQQLLYWFRTPPNIKVGRQPLDEDVRRALEARNPDVQFDWDALRDTPPPMPSVEPWRERRRAERAARQQTDTDEAAEAERREPEPAVAETPLEKLKALAVEPSITAFPEVADSARQAPDSQDSEAVAEPAAIAGAGSVRRRRHRRRGRRGRPGSADPAAVQTESSASSSTEDAHAERPDDEE